MSQRGLLRGALIVVGIAFGAAQFVNPFGGGNPPEQTDSSLYANVDVPGPIKEIIERSCVDCHSNRTRWPWYAKVAPMSWLVARDVAKGREALNMSNWTKGAGKNPAMAASMLLTTCASIKEDRMPVIQYAFMHPESKPTKQDILTFCGWATGEAKALIKRKRAAEQVAKAETEGVKAVEARGGKN